MRSPRRFGRKAACVGGLLAPLAVLICVRSAPASDARVELDEFFHERVAPLLEQRCGECHGPAARRARGGLRLDSRAALLAGGDSGPALDLEDTSASLLLRAVRGEELGLEMPPDGPLGPGEIDVLERWIAAGAPWPERDADRAIDPEHARFFEDRIRPVLAANCFGCHGADLAEVHGAFRMAGRAGLLRGGHRGPAIVPGDADASPLVHALRYEDRHLRMPPAGPLPADVVADIARWIEIGAPWPAYDGPSLEQFDSHGGIDIERARGRWPFTALERPEFPTVAGARTRSSALPSPTPESSRTALRRGRNSCAAPTWTCTDCRPRWRTPSGGTPTSDPTASSV
jgi:mono/diheme cytochrome c family protein